MIPDDQLRLLTAAVDGELTPTEDRRLRVLLGESDAARKVFARLRADRERLRNLAPVAPPAGLRQRVLDRLHEVTPAPVTTPAPAPSARPTRRPSWVPVAVAASLFLAVASGSFWYITRPDQPNGNAAAPLTANADRATTDVLPRDSAPLPSIPRAVEPPPETHVAEVATPPVSPGGRDELPPPRPVAKDVNAFPPLPAIGFDLVRVRVPFLASVSDLDREDVRQKLIEELGRDPAYRIDLFAKDSARGVELFQAAAKASGVTVFADAVSQERVKRRQAIGYVVYVECLSAKELRDLLAKLSAADGKHPQRVFDALHATGAVPADQRELKEVLGTDPGLWKRPASSASTAAEPKPISAGTGDQLTRTLTGPKPGEKPAFLTTFTPAAVRTHPAMSKELKEYLARRGERGASAVPVLIVIRPSAGG
jgi:hypothetical protein